MLIQPLPAPQVHKVMSELLVLQALKAYKVLSDPLGRRAFRVCKAI